MSLFSSYKADWAFAEVCRMISFEKDKLIIGSSREAIIVRLANSLSFSGFLNADCKRGLSLGVRQSLPVKSAVNQMKIFKEPLRNKLHSPD